MLTLFRERFCKTCITLNNLKANKTQGLVFFKDHTLLGNRFDCVFEKDSWKNSMYLCHANLFFMARLLTVHKTLVHMGKYCVIFYTRFTQWLFREVHKNSNFSIRFPEKEVSHLSLEIKFKTILVKTKDLGCKTANFYAEKDNCLEVRRL